MIDVDCRRSSGETVIGSTLWRKSGDPGPTPAYTIAIVLKPQLHFVRWDPNKLHVDVMLLALFGNIFWGLFYIFTFNSTNPHWVLLRTSFQAFPICWNVYIFKCTSKIRQIYTFNAAHEFKSIGTSYFLDSQVKEQSPTSWRPRSTTVQLAHSCCRTTDQVPFHFQHEQQQQHNAIE